MNNFQYGNPLELPPLPEPHESASKWADHVGDEIIRMYEHGCSENQIRFYLTDETIKRDKEWKPCSK